jgi:cytochrome b6-f complex iron-sulfur subunit
MTDNTLPTDHLAAKNPVAQTTDEQTMEEPEDDGLTRRGFVRVAVGGVGVAYAAAIGYPIYRYLNSPVEKSAALAAVHEVALPNADQIPKGSALMFKFGVRPSLLIHHQDGAWVALTAVCTHMGCTVAYNPVSAQIECHCHGGVYDARTGENISGPPPRPLTKFAVKVAPGSVTVTRI